MDPLMQALTLANGAVVLATKIWDATPAEQQKTAASDFALFTHNIGAFVAFVQGRINAGLK